jgi:hypothetical protein
MILMPSFLAVFASLVATPSMSKVNGKWPRWRGLRAPYERAEAEIRESLRCLAFSALG